MSVISRCSCQAPRSGGPGVGERAARGLEFTRRSDRGSACSAASECGNRARFPCGLEGWWVFQGVRRREVRVGGFARFATSRGRGFRARHFARDGPAFVTRFRGAGTSFRGGGSGPWFRFEACGGIRGEPGGGHGAWFRAERVGFRGGGRGSALGSSAFAAQGMVSSSALSRPSWRRAWAADSRDERDVRLRDADMDVPAAVASRGFTSMSTAVAFLVRTWAFPAVVASRGFTLMSSAVAVPLRT